MNFREIFTDLDENNHLYLRKSTSPMNFYYGYDAFGRYCIALQFDEPFFKVSPTKLLLIERQEDMTPNVYWLYISLADKDAKNVFFSFADDLYACIQDDIPREHLMRHLEDRVKCWKRMFGKVYPALTKKEIIGLYGELYFLDKYFIPKMGLRKAFNSWSGPLGSSKDFMCGDKWYEIKTINRSCETILISSLDQLTDTNDGLLVVNKYEEASEEYGPEYSDIMTVYEHLLSQISEDKFSDLRTEFFDKLSKLNFAPDDEYRNLKLKVTDTKFYRVNDDFPRLKEADIKFTSISKVRYELIIAFLKDFEVKEWN